MSITEIPVLCYSRVAGYFAPTNLWNSGKAQEFKERKYYKIPGACNEKNNKELL